MLCNKFIKFKPVLLSILVVPVLVNRELSTLTILPGRGDVTVPALDWAAPVLAQLLTTGLLNSYVSPWHHNVSTCAGGSC